MNTTTHEERLKKGTRCKRAPGGIKSKYENDTEGNLDKLYDDWNN